MYPAPTDITLQGGPVEEDDRYHTSPTASFTATMPKKSGEPRRRMEVEYSLNETGPWIRERDYQFGYTSPGTTYTARVVVGFENGTLQPDTRYHYRVYARGTNGQVVSPYVNGTFITPPTAAVATGQVPASEADISIAEETFNFQWVYTDGDHVETGGEPQSTAYFSWRTAPAAGQPPGPWHLYTVKPGSGTGDQAFEWFEAEPCWPISEPWDDDCQDDLDPEPVGYGSSLHDITLDLTMFPLNQRIEWSVQNANTIWDGNGTYERSGLELQKMFLHLGPPSPQRFFTVIGPTSAPLLLDPTNNEAVVVSEDRLFIWKFRDPVFGTLQTNALLRYKNVFDDDWIYVDLGTNYTDQSYLMPPDTLLPNVHYEWQVSTTNDRNEISEFSTSAFFWGVVAPGSGNIPITDGEPQGALGCGTHRAFIYDRGGQVRRGEVTHLTRVIWDRRRDDISEASLVINNWDDDCGELLTNTHCWQHELVIFREHPSGLYLERVWEGPIVRLAYRRTQVEVYAKDVMVFVYRRIMRQAYNDAYHLDADGVQQGLHSVIFRSAKIISNAMAYDDPNIIGHLTLFEYDDDARQSRVVEAYSKTAWEEVDDLAATAGLDYTTAGRRIILNDTHRPIGNLPEMRDNDFGDDLIVSEYGMQTANVFGVTNNAGVYGLADRLVDGQPQWGYGFIEQLASAYGEATGAATEEVLTPEALAELQATLAEQAERNISGRHPTPVVVRVPDNTTLNPEVEVGVNQLIPGVWMPVRSDATLKKVTQMQKLDKIVMTEERGKEVFTITLSPAPLPGVDAEPPPEET